MINKRDLRSKIWGIYDYIASDLYFSRSDLSFRRKKYNATLLMSLLTGISGGKQLIVGEPGMGKTTSAEFKEIESLQTNQPDIFMITDHVTVFRNSVDHRENIAIFAVNATADIPRIILSKVRDYLYDRQGHSGL